MQPGNTWYNWPGAGCDENHKLSPAHFAVDRPYDVAIIGAGVIGCALVYVLSQYRLRIAIVDQRFDVGEGTSKANSAIIHTGFDATPGSLESQLVTGASRQWPELAQKLKIPFKRVSALMLALDDEQCDALPALRDKAVENGVHDVELVSAQEAKRLEPNISPQVLGGLVVPRESIVDSFTASIAYADVAIGNGVDFIFGLEVSGVDDADGAIKWIVGAGGIRIPARLAINASGLGSRRLVDKYGGEPMDLNPRRGQFVVYDRCSSHLVSRILLPIPTKQTKGMLVAPTIYGNLLAGPTAEDLPPDCIHATNTTAEGLAAVRESGIKLCPALHDQPVIATYAGLRCNCAQGSYWMRFNDGHPGIVTLAGIRSTGLTTSISTAQYVVKRMVEDCGLELHKNDAAIDSRPESRWPGWWRRPFDDRERVADRPDYGRIVCSCENVSRGEIRDALLSCPGTATLDGLKRRTRVLTGRCQGFNCCVPTAVMISQHYGVPLASVTKRGPGTEFIASDGGLLLRAGPTTNVAPFTPRPRYRVAIVGAGPAGIGVAVGLAKVGIEPVLLIDRADEIGGVPAHYEAKRGGVPTFVVWTRGHVLFGRQFVDGLRMLLSRTNTEIWRQSQVVDADKAQKSLCVVSPQAGKTTVQAEAIVFATGAREKSSSERGWIAGHRPARQFFTMQLLQLIDGCHALPMDRPVIVGSDLIAFSAAAKLRAAGSGESTMCDNRPRPAARFFERTYFSRWSRPDWRSVHQAAEILEKAHATSIQFGENFQECDGIVFSGELVPNSELLVSNGFAVSQPDRIPSRIGHNELAAPGWFIAGAGIGGFHGAHWCYRDGRRAARCLARYLRKISATV
jgi:glycerol-3-phosphate dehydrogenase